MFSLFNSLQKVGSFTYNSVMKMFGLYKKDARVIFLGLDDAGKTTLLGVLKDNKVEQWDPTLHAHSEELVIGNLKLCSVDLGGHETVRKVWMDYFPKVDAIIYLIDIANVARFGESKAEFEKIMNASDLGDIPILILGNKCDKVSVFMQFLRIWALPYNFHEIY